MLILKDREVADKHIPMSQQGVIKS